MHLFVEPTQMDFSFVTSENFALKLTYLSLLSGHRWLIFAHLPASVLRVRAWGQEICRKSENTRTSATKSTDPLNTTHTENRVHICAHEHSCTNVQRTLSAHFFCLHKWTCSGCHSPSSSFFLLSVSGRFLVLLPVFSSTPSEDRKREWKRERERERIGLCARTHNHKHTHKKFKTWKWPSECRERCVVCLRLHTRKMRG